ncbi:proteasome assembly chaperone family protein [Vulcanisaeta thermophila]|uniref:proteasome assembly chaperone family protein n=1 Tax=Vulcanisaeta thermophila TaxID=867917 RepID=UPI003F77803B
MSTHSVEQFFEVKIKSVPRDVRNTLILACPEPSLASVITIEYLVETLKMEELGYLKLKSEIPVVTVINGAAKLPYRLFYSKDHAAVVVRQHVPIPPTMYRIFINRILDWAEENNINRVVCLTATPVLSDKELDNVYFVSEEGFVNDYASLGFVPLKEATITGVEAVFLDAVLSRNINGVLIMAESKVLTAINRLVESGKLTSHRDVLAILNQTVGQLGPDVTAALKLVRAVSKIIGVDIPTDNLAEHAKKYAFLLEKNLEEFMKPSKTEVPVIY